MKPNIFALYFGFWSYQKLRSWQWYQKLELYIFSWALFIVIIQQHLPDPDFLQSFKNTLLPLYFVFRINNLQFVTHNTHMYGKDELWLPTSGILLSSTFF